MSTATPHRLRLRLAIPCAAAIGFAVGSGCSQPAMVEELGLVEQSGFDFEQYEVIIGSAKRPSVLTGFLLGGASADLAVVSLDEKGDRRLRIYALGDGTWAPKLDTTLRTGVSFVDLVNIGGRDRLVTYEPGRLCWFDPESSSAQELVEVTSSFDPPRAGEIPHVDITRDLNADGRDDLVVPDVDGFWVFVQTESGAFAEPVKIGPPTDLSRITGADGYRYDCWGQSRVHQMDYDHDGRADLVFWSGDHFEVHIQDERGLFAPLARTFTTEVAFDSDDLSALANEDLTGRVLHSLADLNGDGVGDLVVHTLSGKRISKKLSTYELHFGARAADGGTAFASEADATFQSKGRIQLGLDRLDFDGDGLVDLMLTTIQLRFLEGSLWKTIKGAMGDDIWLELEFYRNEGGHYPDEPNAIRTIGLDGAPSHREPGSVSPDIVLQGATHEERRTRKSWPRAFNPNLLIGDVTGDGRTDVLIEATFRGLDLFVGVPGPDLFARRPQSVAVVVPHDREYTWLVDLDQDGKQDILMHHPFTLRDVHGGRKRPPGTEPHRVVVLISR